ncbi:MerR family transcriptional regulator [Wukongibacter baidiensis]|uniref:MerR family transcriptional regulator n=1 Tax=Wukongibacter baidiensis TaxID=1723361 RepID=UPI003D7FCE5D
MSYSIGQTSKKVGLSTHTLRYYEKEGLIPPIKKNINGVRVYSDNDIGKIEFVRCLKETGMTIADIRDIINLHDQNNTHRTISRKKEILTRHRQKVLEDLDKLNKYLDKIDKKIEILGHSGCSQCSTRSNEDNK